MTRVGDSAVAQKRDMPLNSLIFVSNPNRADRSQMCFSICITSATHGVQMLQPQRSWGTVQAGGQKSIRVLLKARWNLDESVALIGWTGCS